MPIVSRIVGSTSTSRISLFGSSRIVRDDGSGPIAVILIRSMAGARTRLVWSLSALVSSDAAESQLGGTG
jgi:hypothetical protein